MQGKSLYKEYLWDQYSKFISLYGDSMTEKEKEEIALEWEKLEDYELEFAYILDELIGKYHNKNSPWSNIDKTIDLINNREKQLEKLI
jgi:hypothetical protein